MHKQGFNPKLEVLRIPFLPCLNVNKPRVSLIRNNERVCLCPEKSVPIPPVVSRLELVRNDKFFLNKKLSLYTPHGINKARHIRSIKLVIPVSHGLHAFTESFLNIPMNNCATGFLNAGFPLNFFRYGLCLKPAGAGTERHHITWGKNKHLAS